MRKNIIEKIKEANLLGRGGAGFPVWMKWEAVKKQEGKKIFIIANGSEGEPSVFKDEYILKNYPKEFIEGIKIALKTFSNSEAIIYLNHKYYDKYKKSLEKFSRGFPITYFRKTGKYIAGEETGLLSHIEGKRIEPRPKPPYPTESGLYNLPTLINNIETFYRVCEIEKGKYTGKAFFSISGSVKNKGVFEFPENYPIKKILEETENWPNFDFFVQVGGGASGEIFLPKELNMPKRGAASIVVFNKEKTDPIKLMKFWAQFYAEENCDKCTPCRESSLRILEMVKKEKIDYKKINEMFFSLEKTSFCPLGKGMANPYRTLIAKILK
jgi:NADH:ubiquinone oxidoreductase subunit F (NADH-binding)